MTTTMDTSTLIASSALLLAAAACWTDLRTRRIPNHLVLAGFATGLVLNAGAAGLSGIGRALAGAAVGLALFLPFMLLGGMGGGDVKLMAALGSLVGPGDVVKLALATALAGGVLALLRVLREGRLRATLTGMAGLLSLWFTTGLRPSPELNLSNPSTIRIPYAVAIAAGTMAVVVLPWSRL
jgi:prepilin peptidase CpaA